MLTQIIQHRCKILRLPGHKPVANAGNQHQLCKGRDHLLPANPDLDTLAGRQADVIAGLLMEGGQQLVVRLALQVQAEDIARLDGFKCRAGMPAAEASILHHLGKDGVVRGDVRVHFDHVAVILPGKCPQRCDQLLKRRRIVHIAHRAAAAVHHPVRQARDLANQRRDGALDLPVLPPAGDGPPEPHRLLLGPVRALGKIPLGVALVKGLKFL